MIDVLLERRKNGVFRSCKAEGHAGYARKGSDIVCSAVTVLLRTSLQMLEETKGIELESKSPVRGFLDFNVKDDEFDSGIELRLIHIEEFLEKGISSLSKEFPENVTLQIKTV